MVRYGQPPAQILPAVANCAYLAHLRRSFTQAEFARDGSALPYKRVREKIQGIPIYLRL